MNLSYNAASLFVSLHWHYRTWSFVSPKFPSLNFPAISFWSSSRRRLARHYGPPSLPILHQTSPLKPVKSAGLFRKLWMWWELPLKESSRYSWVGQNYTTSNVIFCKCNTTCNNLYIVLYDVWLFVSVRFSFSTWIGSGVARDLNDLRRVHQLLVSSLGKLQQVGLPPTSAAAATPQGIPGIDLMPRYPLSACVFSHCSVLIDDNH